MPRRSNLAQRLRSICTVLLLAGIGAPALAQSPAGEPLTAEEIVAAATEMGLETPLVPYDQFPFPEVADGQLWVPELGFSPVSAIIPYGRWQDFPAPAQATLKQAHALVRAGKGQDAIALLNREAVNIPVGQAYALIADIYQRNAGGVSRDEVKYRAALAQQARFDPDAYYRLGTGAFAEATTAREVHLLSKGLSRGCTRCIGPLLTARAAPRKGKGSGEKLVPAELRLLYAAVALEMGHSNGPSLLSDAIHEVLYVEKLGERKGDPAALNAAALATAMREEVELMLGAAGLKETHPKYPLAPIAMNRLRTGLVPASLVQGVALAQRGNRASGVTRLLLAGQWGRYGPTAIDAVMQGTKKGELSSAAENTLVVRAAEWGHPRLWAAASLVESSAMKLLVASNGKLEVSDRRASQQAYKPWLAAGKAYGLLAERMGTAPRSVLGVVTAVKDNRLRNAAETNAEECVRKSLSSSNPSSMLGLCEGVVVNAWKRGADPTLGGQLSEALFRRLGADADVQAVAEARRRRDNDVQARLGSLNAQRREEDRRLAASGLQRKPLDSQATLTQARENVAWANKGARSGPVASSRPPLDRMYAAFVARSASGSGGSGVRDALGQVESDQVCGDWAYRDYAQCAP